LSNLSRLNQGAVNSGTTFAFVSATAVWAAVATTSIAEPNITHRAHANFDGVVAGVFGGYKENFGQASLIANTDSNIQAHRISGAKGAWSANGEFNSYITNYVISSIGFDAEATILFIPNAVFAHSNLNADLGWAASSNKTQYISGDWNSAVDAVFVGGEITRYVEANLASTSKMFVDGHFDVDGSTSYDGYFNVEAFADWDTDIFGTRTGILVNFVSQENTTNFAAYHTSFINGTWTSVCNSSLVASILAEGALTFSSTGALEAASFVVANGEMGLITTSELIGYPAIVYSANMEAFVTAECLSSAHQIHGVTHGLFAEGTLLPIDAIRVVNANMDLNVNAAQAIRGEVFKLASTAMVSLGGWLAAAGLIELGPAPINRQFTIEATERSYVVDASIREFIT